MYSQFLIFVRSFFGSAGRPFPMITRSPIVADGVWGCPASVATSQASMSLDDAAAGVPVSKLLPAASLPLAECDGLGVGGWLQLRPTTVAGLEWMQASPPAKPLCQSPLLEQKTPLLWAQNETQEKLITVTLADPRYARPGNYY